MPKKILIIDDDPIVVKYLEAVFSDNGYETCTASSTMEGLDAVKKERPDLITLDLNMPGQDGGKVYAKLKADDALKSIPVCIVTGKINYFAAFGRQPALFSRVGEKRDRRRGSNQDELLQAGQLLAADLHFREVAPGQL